MPERTFELIKILYSHQIEFIIDPGKMIADMPKEDLATCIETAAYTVLNRYELALLGESLSESETSVLSRMNNAVITDGSSAIKVYTKELIREKPEDPYGAGDAFLGGFSAACFYGGKIREAARTGAVAASFALEQKGTQNHRFTPSQFIERYKQTYRDNPSLLFSES